VEEAERDIARVPDPAPHGRLDPGKGDRELVDRNFLGRRRRSARVRYPLFSEDSLHLADSLLDLPTYLFDLAFGF
jgi:hypothetical protein